MRLINAFELKQRILEERDKIPLTLPGAVYELGIEKPNHHGNAMRGGIRKALRCMEQCYNYTLADTVNQTQRWIPVSERLPEVGDRCLCNVKSFAFPGSFYQAILKYDKYGFVEDCIYTDDVTHWMPLPEPPKENADEVH